jgi:alkylation response protein AidB-like acyl-CoA dehydrogenase
MELEFTPDQEALRDSVGAVLARECPSSLVRAAIDDRAPAEGLWRQMVELGWPALTIPEEAGGIGLGAVELAVVVEELGRVLAPGPFLATVTQLEPVVREVGTPEQAASLLGAIAEGTSTGTLALSERGVTSFDPARVQTTASRVDGGWRLDGEKTAVLSGDEVDELVVVARVDDAGGIGAFLVARAVAKVQPIESMDPTRSLVDVLLEAVHVDDTRVLGEPGVDAVEPIRRAVDEAVTALSLETVGACQSILDITLDYAKGREQFGVPIGSFQAIKHKFADLMISLERARATGYYAALTIAEDDPRRVSAAAVAKVAAGDCQRHFAKEGIQIHGGIGYTWEHDMQLYVKRIKSNEPLFGTSAFHRARIASELGV